VTRMRHDHPPRDLTHIQKQVGIPDPKHLAPDPKLDAKRKANRKSLKAGKREYKFLVECAQAFWKRQLTAQTPSPPRELKADVRAYGGNLAWLAGIPSRNQLFTQLKKQVQSAAENSRT
jgi:hypothetical protein